MGRKVWTNVCFCFINNRMATPVIRDALFNMKNSMEEFFPDQRWTSTGEPELGVGIVTEVAKGRVTMHFPLSGETRMYAADNAPVRRASFKPGDTVADAAMRPMLIERVEQDGHLLLYIGQSRMLSEADLGNVSVKHGVEDRLLTGDVDTPEMFAMRRQTLQYDHRRRISPVNGFVGGRIDLIPHQLYIAHEVSARYAPRVLLSDQVGLGKTIEACLILHRLLLSGRVSRVLILVPESLVHQWFVEVLRRFNLWVHIFDERRCASLDGSAPDGNPFLDDQLVLCSTSFLASKPKRARQALSADWDMLVVDEAHHLEWSPEKVSKEYAVVELLSKVAKGLLLLTATPEQLGAESHFARLRLLDPVRYADYEAFRNEPSGDRSVANAVEDLSAGKRLPDASVKLLEAMFGKERVAALATGGDAARDGLIEDVLDQHGPGRVIFRNTRSAMKGFPRRKAHLIALASAEQPELWAERMAAEFMADTVAHEGAPAEPEYWFAEDPRLAWLVKMMKKLQGAKILLICRSKQKVLALERVLEHQAGLKVGVFHEDLTIVQRDRNAAWFSEPDGARLLICSEIGSEGRNFQFAHHLVLFDLPQHPELLEQRIGRLDRIGQTEDIHIHVPYLSGSPQEVLVRWFHEGLNVFEENLEGGNAITQLFGERLRAACLSAAEDGAAEQVGLLIRDTAAFHQELKAKLANGRDRLLEMNSFRPRRAAKLVDAIRAEDSDMCLEWYMTRVFNHFNVEMEDLAARSYILHRPKHYTEVFPSIPDAGMAVTFDRKRALSREDIGFISWDHPMATEAVDMVLSSGTGSASYGIVRGSGSPAILMECIFVLETAGEKSIDIDRFLPKTPLRVVVDHTGKAVTDVYPAEQLDLQLTPGKMDDVLDNEMLMETVIPSMISAATKYAEALGAQEMKAGLQRMNLILDHEIERLKSLQMKNNNIRPEEILIAQQDKASLASLIGNARIRLDALQLIRKGKF